MSVVSLDRLSLGVIDCCDESVVGLVVLDTVDDDDVDDNDDVTAAAAE